jgi:hypothetical protein
VDRRFSKSPPFVFAWTYYIERQQLENAINMSVKKGKISCNVDGSKSVMSVDDGFTCFKKISGTSAYWQQAKYELQAKIKKLGGFKFFFTLSTADKRWKEIYTTILRTKGHQVNSTEAKTSAENLTTEDGDIFVNNENLEDVMKNESTHDMVKHDILTTTRVFDNRLKMFMKHIIRGKGNPMDVQYFNYRIEFQARGKKYF